MSPTEEHLPFQRDETESPVDSLKNPRPEKPFLRHTGRKIIQDSYQTAQAVAWTGLAFFLVLVCAGAGAALWLLLSPIGK